MLTGDQEQALERDKIRRTFTSGADWFFWIAGLLIINSIILLFQGEWSFIVGMVLYFFDGLIFLLVQDWLSIGFHGFALFCIFGGYSAMKKLAETENLKDGTTAG